MKKLLSAVALLGLSGALYAAEPAENIVAQLKAVDPRIPVEGVVESPLPGVYEVTLASGEVLYADAEGKYLLAGELYQVDADKGLVNLTEQKQNAPRKDMIDAVAAEEFVSYKPEGDVKGQISVFTDVNCGACRQFHNRIVPGLLERGIQVNYLAYPVIGRERSKRTMEHIWCAGPEERLTMMDKAKAGDPLGNDTCDTSPVDKHLQMGRQMKINSTPSLVLEDGTLVRGMRAPDELARMMGIL